MLRLRPERVHAILAPGQLVLARSASDSVAYPLQADGADMDSVLAQLEQAVGEYAKRKCRLQLMLAGDYARYALTAPVDTLLSEREEAVLARQAFRERYGDASQEWEIRFRPQELGKPFLACSVEPGLVKGMQSLKSKPEIRVESIRPLLAEVYAQPGWSRHAKDGWLAILEPGWLHLVLLQDRAWVQLASTRTFGGWADDLNILLMREASLHGQDAKAPLWLVSAVPNTKIPAQFDTWHWLPGQLSGASNPYLGLVLGKA